MLSKGTVDCLALANTAIMMRLIQSLAERNLIGAPIAMLKTRSMTWRPVPNKVHVSMTRSGLSGMS